eukprot:356712-Chlamydomonas_euryale.AAC.6
MEHVSAWAHGAHACMGAWSTCVHGRMQHVSAWAHGACQRMGAFRACGALGELLGEHRPHAHAASKVQCVPRVMLQRRQVVGSRMQLSGCWFVAPCTVMPGDPGAAGATLSMHVAPHSTQSSSARRHASPSEYTHPTRVCRAELNAAPLTPLRS